MKVFEGKVWGSRSRDLRGLLVDLAQKHEVRLTITGISTRWITKTIEFEASGPEDALIAFRREAAEALDR